MLLLPQSVVVGLVVNASVDGSHCSNPFLSSSVPADTQHVIFEAILHAKHVPLVGILGALGLHLCLVLLVEAGGATVGWAGTQI